MPERGGRSRHREQSHQEVHAEVQHPAQGRQVVSFPAHRPQRRFPDRAAGAAAQERRRAIFRSVHAVRQRARHHGSHPHRVQGARLHAGSQQAVASVSELSSGQVPCAVFGTGGARGVPRRGEESHLLPQGQRQGSRARAHGKDDGVCGRGELRSRAELQAQAQGAGQPRAQAGERAAEGPQPRHLRI